MLISKDFFEVLSINDAPLKKDMNTGTGNFTARIKLNPMHDIYKGHFQNKPILPGVCMLQMVVDTVSLIQNKALQLQVAKSLKFIKPVDPNIIPQLDLQLMVNRSDDHSLVKGKVYWEDDIYFKVNATLAPES